MLALNTIHKLDCIEAMGKLDEGAVDLVFADPPFNIGYEYDVYKDRKAPPEYLDWSRQWISSVHRVLKPTGTFWLAIGDDYAAELKILSQEIGFHCRSWVIWYYTFGVNCKFKFSRSHTHIFHFVKNPKKFTFNGSSIAVKSARQTVYADSRASKDGRLPDDSWILRPQNLTDGLNPDEDTWYFPRVAGTFKEREGFHGCQMPEQLLGRIIDVSSNPGELILDPFSGSATTAVVAKKRCRKFLAFDISDEYIARGTERVSKVEPGDILDGSADPKLSAPPTPSNGAKRGRLAKVESTTSETLPNFDDKIVEAYQQTSSGYSTDRLLIDPHLNTAFLNACQQLGALMPAVSLNRRLLRLRKSGKLSHIKTSEMTTFRWEKADAYLFASEIAWRTVYDKTGASLDDILCNPSLSELFDSVAGKFAPGFSSMEYRWGALTLRKAAKSVSTRSHALDDPGSRLKLVREEQFEILDGQAGLYAVSTNGKEPLFVGEALNLGAVLSQQFRNYPQGWAEYQKPLIVKAVPYSRLPSMDINSRGAKLSLWLVAYQYRLIQRSRPKLNQLGLKETFA
jgi:DNA modification methylase